MVNSREGRTSDMVPSITSGRGTGTECDVDLPGLSFGDLYCPLLRPELLLPGLDDVLARRQPLERERPVGPRDLVERMVVDRDESIHPGVDVAADRHHLGR